MNSVYLTDKSEIRVKVNHRGFNEVSIDGTAIYSLPSEFCISPVVDRVNKIKDLMQRNAGHMRYRGHGHVEVYYTDAWSIHNFIIHLDTLYRNNKRWLEGN